VQKHSPSSSLHRKKSKRDYASLDNIAYLLLLLQVPISRLAQMFSPGSSEQPLQDEQGRYYL
jgi:hypothetical protein